MLQITVVHYPTPCVKLDNRWLQIRRPYHAAFMDLHLMGIHRGLYRNDVLSYRYNKAVGTEFMYRQMGLIIQFSMS